MTTPASHLPRGAKKAVVGLASIVGILAAVEIVSGILQGFYTPIYSDIARHLAITDADVNWFEAAQLMVSALVVPVLARSGDLIGHKKVLLLSTAVTALASWGIAFSSNFWLFLVAWALQGFYVVWLPVEIAIIHRRTANSGQQARLTRRSAGLLVAALETGVIVGALLAGALVDVLPIQVVLAIPAVAVTICLPAIWFGVAETPPQGEGRIDWRGFGVATAIIALVMAGLMLLRLLGPDSFIPWITIALGLAIVWPFLRLERNTQEPLIDVDLIAQPRQWPIQLTAFLFGMSVLGAQIPLSTFARTDRDTAGFGLSASAFFVTILIAIYVLCMAVGALLMPLVARWYGTRTAMIAACGAVALGYGLFLPLHDSTVQTAINMAIAGIGSGALVASLPAAAAAAAPANRTGLVTGLTNTTKTIGGGIASAVFAIALASAGSIDTDAGHASLEGYLIVWGVCSGTALIAALCLLAVPKHSLEDASPPAQH